MTVRLRLTNLKTVTGDKPGKTGTWGEVPRIGDAAARILAGSNPASFSKHTGSV